MKIDLQNTHNSKRSIGGIDGAVNDVTAALGRVRRSAAVVRVNGVSLLTGGVLMGGLEWAQSCRLLEAVRSITPVNVP